MPNVPSADSYYEKVSGYQESVVIRNKLYPKGIYNVTLQNGSTPENRRIIIK
ncbi:MAG: hypothetical protein ACSW76_01875 [Bacteroidaceae bacterium]